MLPRRFDRQRDLGRVALADQFTRAAQDAVDAPRVHYTPEGLFAEPGVPAEGLAASGLPVTLFRSPNLYFGGCQAVARDPATGALTGGADPRRGGAVA